MSDEVPDEGESAGEWYWDKAQGRQRRRRGHRKGIRRGPYSVQEDAAIRAFDKWLTAERAMHGALAQPTCADIATFLTRARSVCERYSYENVPDVTGLDPHIIFEEMDIQPYDNASVSDPADDVDIYEGLRLHVVPLASRAPAHARAAQPQILGDSVRKMRNARPQVQKDGACIAR